MGHTEAKPVLMVQILENMENPSLKKSYIEYFDNNFDKSFNDLKDNLLKSDGYHHCVLKICYYDKNEQLQEYEDANIKTKPLLIKDSKFKIVKEKNANKLGKKSTIPIILLNNGECICEQLYMERFEKIMEEKYKGREDQYRKEIEDLQKKRDEHIKNINSIEQIKKQAARKDTEIRKLQEQINFIIKKKKIQKKREKKFLMN